MPLMMAVTFLCLSFLGCQLGLGDMAVPLTQQHGEAVLRGNGVPAAAVHRPWSPVPHSQALPVPALVSKRPFQSG